MCTSCPSTDVDEPRIGPLVVCTTSLSIIPCTWHTFTQNHRMQIFNIFCAALLFCYHTKFFSSFFSLEIILELLCCCSWWFCYYYYYFHSKNAKKFSTLFYVFINRKAIWFEGKKSFVLISYAQEFCYKS